MRTLNIICDNCGADLTKRVQLVNLSEARGEVSPGELHAFDDIPTGDYCGLQCLMEVLVATARAKQARDAEPDNITE